jgi:eukaryotic-like serine/threonine-protein kinase
MLVAIKDDEYSDSAEVLPDGTHLLFSIATGMAATDRWDKARVVVQSLKSGEPKTLIQGASSARYLPTGHLLYATGGSIFAVPFDAQRLELTGPAVAVVEGVRRSPGGVTGAAMFDVSRTGSLIYIPGPPSTSSGYVDVALADRQGNIQPLKLPPGPYEVPRISPDGKRIAFGSAVGAEAVVWKYELTGIHQMQRITFGGNNRFPIWSSDSRRLAFQSDREGDLGIFSQDADGTGQAERLTKADAGTAHVPESWSSKGDALLFTVNKGSEVSLWTLSFPDKKIAPFDNVHTRIPTGAVFSPDGRWVAYASDESTRVTIYVQPFPPTGAKYQIFTKLGDSPHHPIWSPDGRELFYNPRPTGFEAVSVTTTPTLAFGTPIPVPRSLQMAAPAGLRTLDVTPDGKFLGLLVPGQVQSGTPEPAQIQVVLNWFEELKQRVASGR